MIFSKGIGKCRNILFHQIQVISILALSWILLHKPYQDVSFLPVILASFRNLLEFNKKIEKCRNILFHQNTSDHYFGNFSKMIFFVDNCSWQPWPIVVFHLVTLVPLRSLYNYESCPYLSSITSPHESHLFGSLLSVHKSQVRFEKYKNLKRWKDTITMTNSHHCMQRI